MCIRDSPETVSLAQFASQANTIEPVSYTHLTGTDMCNIYFDDSQNIIVNVSLTSTVTTEFYLKVFVIHSFCS